MDIQENLSPSVPSYQPINYNFQFNGTSGEYFRIWIVNTLLTLVTFGIYSAWAKVRTRKYLYQHTQLNGSTFDYHADPIKILKGRILMGAVGLLYAFGGKISPTIPLAAGAIFAVLFPWIVVRGNIFNLSNTSYRNLRFGFNRDYAGSYAAYIKGFFVALITLGIGWYYALWCHTNFKINSSKFGQTNFKFNAEAGPYFKMMFIGGCFYLLGTALLMLTSFLISPIFGEGAMGGIIGGVLAVVLLYGSITAGVAYTRAHMLNYNLSHTRIGDNELRAKLEWTEFAFLYVTNLFAIALTLGLAIPWAMIRVHEYKLSRCYVKAPNPDSMDNFLQSNQVSEGVLADAAVDLWDIDIGF